MKVEDNKDIKMVVDQIGMKKEVEETSMEATEVEEVTEVEEATEVEEVTVVEVTVVEEESLTKEVEDTDI